MKKYLFFILLTVALGCVHENEMLVSEPAATLTRLSVITEQEPQTKATLSDLTGGYYIPLWEEDDSLAVFTAAGQKPIPFTLVSGAGEARALFEGELVGERYVALFPYRPDATFDGNEVSFEIPSVQHYRPEASLPKEFPMLGVGAAEILQFRNLCSVIRLALTGDCLVGSITLSSDDGVLSGPVGLNISEDASPTLQMKEGCRKEVKLDCLGVPLSEEEPTFFHIVVPAGSYNGLRITIDTFAGTVTKTITHEVTIERSEWRPVTPFLVESPTIDLNHLPDNQVWYKTKTGNLVSFDHLVTEQKSSPFDANIVSHLKWNGYGILIMDAPVTVINDRAFYGSEAISELHLPDCVEEIRWYAIPGGLPSLRIPGSIRKISYSNLIGHERIYGPTVASDDRSIVVDKELIGVLDTHLDEYITPPGIESLGEQSISCKGFKSIVVSEGVRRINQAIDLCPDLESITLPESVIDINFPGQNPKLKGFYGSSRCTSEDHKLLFSPIYGRVVAAVSDDNAETYAIPEGVQSIGTNFRNWPHLKSLILPSTLQSIVGGQISYAIPSLESFGGANVTEDGRCVIIDRVLYSFIGNGIKDYTFPGEVEQVYHLALGLSQEIEHIRFSEGTSVLMTGALGSCTNLKTVEFPTTIQFLSNGIFDGDYNLEKVYLPVRIPPEVVSGENMSILGEHPEAFTKLKIYVPEESLADYLADSFWYECWPYLEGYHFDKIDPDVYNSSDYSSDGVVTVLQQASEGNGIDIVLMGDAFSDRLIQDGTYLKLLKDCAEALFEEEPYRSFRHLFNVYVVNAVSTCESIGSIYGSDRTVFETYVDYEGYLGGNMTKCLEYAQKAIPEARLNEVDILIMANYTSSGGGTCTMAVRSETRESDYGSGVGVAFIPRGNRHVLTHHELGGHGFAKLMDEYSNRAYDEAPIGAEWVEQFNWMCHHYGWYKNIDFTANPATVKWARFLSDARYTKELLSVYEGGAANWKRGVYRPSYNSIMNLNYGGFNAPSREAIYYRIHKLAYGPEWVYDYEEFVRWDQGAENIRPTAVLESVPGKKTYEVRAPLPSRPVNLNEWTVTVMK